MTVKEFTKMFANKKMTFLDLEGRDISRKPRIILDCMQVIGSEHKSDGTIVVDVAYIE